MIDHTELFDALDELLAAEKELRRQRRALFPCVLRRRKATSRLLAVYRALKGDPAEPPEADRPILDAIDRAPGRELPPPPDFAAPAVAEELPAADELEVLEARPDGSAPTRPRARGRKRRPLVWVAEPAAGWSGEALYAAARQIAGKTEKSSITATEAQKTVVCNRCNAARNREAGACPQCRCPEYRSYTAALQELMARAAEPEPEPEPETETPRPKRARGRARAAPAARKEPSP